MSVSFSTACSCYEFSFDLFCVCFSSEDMCYTKFNEFLGNETNENGNKNTMTCTNTISTISNQIDSRWRVHEPVD